MNNARSESHDKDSIAPFSKRIGGWLQPNSKEKVTPSSKMFSQKSLEGNAGIPSTSEDNGTKSGPRQSLSNNLNATLNSSKMNEEEQTLKEKLNRLGSINLRPLIRHLLSEELLKEDNIPWLWNSVFTEVASKLRAEWENSKSEDNPT